MKCTLCRGGGVEEHPAYYYGRAECPRCQGLGVVNDNGNPLTESQWDAYTSYPGDPEELSWPDEEPDEEDEE